ncbi:MAG TPA: hypothetical protein PKW33_05360 [Anaerolineaceae bacterium]|nr:hypothetical protein [Anaerolineaceae bacterium]HPN50993.1 hypothetical protein [Anaerolineaceae bacterium]
MRPKIVILHFGAQCPWHRWIIEQAWNANEVVGGTLEIIDVTRTPETAAQYRLFSPFMTIINDKICTAAPLTKERIMELMRERPAPRALIEEEWRTQERAGRIEPLGARNVLDACSLCIQMGDRVGRIGSLDKLRWLNQQENGDNLLGLVAYQGDVVVGAVEALPADKIPYPGIEKTHDKAFITCLYALSNGSDGPVHDCRGHLLEELIQRLQGKYQALQVIAGKNEAYPNGPCSLFAHYGFVEVARIEPLAVSIDQDEWRLMEKPLTE